MMEKIYTIPVNEAFESAEGCPLCALRGVLEAKEIDEILGPAVMEPDIRMRTNREGFCIRHYAMMVRGNDRLSLALMLDTHLDAIIRENLPRPEMPFAFNPRASAQRLKKIEESCYVCANIERHFSNMLETVFYLWSCEEQFRKKLAAVKLFCLPHYRMLLERAQTSLSAKDWRDFAATVYSIEKRYLESLSGDIKWFCQKFDYRFAQEDWKNSKDAIERVIAALTGENPRSDKQGG